MKLSTLGSTLSSTVGSETKDFRKEFEHPELDGALSGGKDSGELVTPVSGPNPALKEMPGPTVSGPTGPRHPDFMYQKSYMGEGNSEMQGKPMTDIPLNDFKRDAAHITTA